MSTDNDLFDKISPFPWRAVERCNWSKELEGFEPPHVRISRYLGDGSEPVARMVDATMADAELIAKSPEMAKLLDRLVGVDWCIGYEMTTEQMVEIDDIRTSAYELLRGIQERLRV